MEGLNFSNLSKDFISEVKRRGEKCVFISHQHEDTEYCRYISDYLRKAGINVFFDADQNLGSNPYTLVNDISNGIKSSTHMLCVISKNTLNSHWVPWEVGFGYDKTSLSVLTLKGISNSDMPDYLKIVSIVRGEKSLNEYISKVLSSSEQYLINESRISSHLMKNHPLDNYLDYDL